MPFAASNYLESKLLKHTYKNQPYPSPTAVYLGLFTSNPGESGLGAEISGGAYIRQQITFGAPGSQADSSQAVSNSSIVTFPIAVADWGVVTHGAIIDTASGGNILFYGSLSDSKTVRTGDTFQVQVGNLKVVSANATTTAYLQAKWLNHVLRGVAYQSPTNIYLGLANNFGNEPVSAEYLRQNIVFSEPVEQADGKLQATNTNEPVFPTPTSSWGDISFALLFDSVTGGNALNKADMRYVQPIGIGDILKAFASTVNITID